MQSADGDDPGLIESLCAMGQVRLDLGSTTEAMSAFKQALELAEQKGTGLPLLILEALEGVAMAGAAADPEQSLRLFAGCDSVRWQSGALAWPRRRRSWKLLLERALARRLTGEVFVEDRAHWSLQGILELGRQISGSKPIASSNDAPDLLTPREREVADLLTLGLSNQQIAMRLAISVGTVRAHVEHILSKLGFHSRAQVALWALREHRLLA
jgi:non-specific serine/threonine protein kinase